jgi:hypothetical protein
MESPTSALNSLELDLINFNTVKNKCIYQYNNTRRSYKFDIIIIILYEF